MISTCAFRRPHPLPAAAPEPDVPSTLPADPDRAVSPLRRTWMTCGLLLALVGLRPPASMAVVPEVVETVTADDLVLRMLHYPNPGGKPVILQTGFTANHLAMDMPVEGYSIASWFHARGYDVYVSNLRGHGTDAVRSEAPADCAWTFDDFVAYDVGAIINCVRERSGQAPFWVGHSMGGMVAYGYLQGAHYEDVVVDQHWQRHGLFDWELVDDRAPRIVADPLLAAERQSQLAGLVTISSPPRLVWETYITWWNWPLWLFDGDKFWSYNLIVDQLAHDTGAQIAVSLLDCIPLEDVVDFMTTDIRAIPFVGDLLADFLAWVFDEIADSFLLVDIFVEDNMDDEVLNVFVTQAFDNISSRVTQQFMQAERKHGLRAYDHRDPLYSPYRYGKGMDLIALPVLFLSGQCDKLANDHAIKVYGFDAVASEDRTLHRVMGHGHGDIVLGTDAFDVTWGPVEEWIRTH